jgi:hypothetical protein
LILKVAPPHVDARFWADIGSEQLIGHRIGASVGFIGRNADRTARRG